MKKFKSTINNRSASFKNNKKAMLKLIKKLNGFLKLSKNAGSPGALIKAKQRGKSLSSEKLNLILDKESPYLELMPLAGMKHENGFGPGGTTSCILGYVSNKLCLINSNIGTKKGGVVDYATSLKNLRIGQIAEENKLTLINLVESGGANLPDQDKVFTNYGKMFCDMSKRSKKGIMTISIEIGRAHV